jgi:hypothetical protein
VSLVRFRAPLAQENGQPIAQKMDRSIRRGACFNEYNISQIKPAFDVAIKGLSEIEAIA